MFNFLRREGDVAFVFFNCDKEKTHGSMNIFYNSTIYRDRRDSRRELWKKIKEQIAAGNIEIDENNMQTVRESILAGDPLKANDLITYGAIISVKAV